MKKLLHILVLFLSLSTQAQVNVGVIASGGNRGNANGRTSLETPEAPVIAADDYLNTISATHPAGLSEIEVSTNNGAYVAYTGVINVGNVALVSGYYKFRTRASATRNVSAVSLSPAFTISTAATIAASPTIVADDGQNTIYATHTLGYTEILISINNAPYVQYDGALIQVGNVARDPGYYKFKTKAAPNRLESAVSISPAFTVAVAAPPSNNINYYISNTGNVNNSGLDSLHPWPLSKVQGAYSNPIKNYNININFHRGETFTGVVDIGGYFMGSPQTDTLRYQAYGAGAKPILTTMAAVPNSTNTSSWILHSPNVWKIATNLNTRPRIWLNGTEAVRAKYPADITSTKKVSWTNDATNGQFLYLYATSNPATFYSSIQSPNFTPCTLSIDGQGTIAIRGLDIRGGNDQTVNIAYVKGLIEDCLIGQQSVGHGVILGNVNGFRITNNRFETGWKTKNEFYNTSENGGGEGVAMYSYNTITNVEVDNNQFYNWIHSAVWMEQQGGPGVTMSNINVHHNFATAPDLIYGRGFGAYGFSTASNLRIEYNVFRNFPVQNQICSPGLFVRYNTIDSIWNTNDGNHLIGVGWGINVGGHNKYYAQNMTVAFNTISNCEEGGIDLEGAFYDNQTQPIAVKNNIFNSNTFIHNGYNVINHPDELTRTPANLDVMIRNRLAVQNNTWTNNVFTRLSTDSPVFYGHDATSSYLKTIVQFNTQNGTAGDVITGNSILQQ